MQEFEIICRNCNSVKFKIRYRWRGKEKEIALRDILPKDFCLLAFHSIYPYMYTYFTGGWFNWVNYNEHLIVNCPSPNGIAMYIKAPSKGSSNFISIEVMKTNARCHREYKLKDSLAFNFDDENRLRFRILDRAISFIFDEDRKGEIADGFFCNVDGERMFCWVEFEALFHGEK